MEQEAIQRSRALYTNKSGKKDGYDQYGYMSLDALLRKLDFVSVHIPYDKSIGTVMGEEELDKMKDGAYLINC